MSAKGRGRSLIAAESIKFGLPVNLHIIFSLAVTAVIFLIAYFTSRKATSGVPPRAQNLGEAIVEFLADYVEPEVGKDLTPTILPWLGALFIYILLANWLGLLPFSRSPTSDISTTLGLAVTAVVGVVVFNIKVNGPKRATKQYLKPVVWLFLLLIPLAIIDNVARMLSLGLRLFGNIAAEHLVFEKLSTHVPYFLPMILLLLGLLVGLIQAIVFTILNLFYIVEDLGLQEEE